MKRTVAASLPVIAPLSRRARTITHLLLSLIVLATVAMTSRRVQAQSVEQVATIPPNVVLANYDSVPIGPFGGLEGGAYVARVSDASAAWFNPAGLSREPGAQVSPSAGVYKWIAHRRRSIPDDELLGAGNRFGADHTR